MQSPTLARQLLLSDLNPLLTCVLCHGYMIDATTIIECLHSFCRTCIYRYLSTSKYCPICDVQVHKTKPLLNIRPDKTMQSMVYKLVPGLLKAEMCRRHDFYAVHRQRAPSEAMLLNSPEELALLADETSCIVSPLEKEQRVSLCLQISDRLPPLSKASNAKPRIVHHCKQMLNDRRFLLCPSCLTVGHIKRFLRVKLELPIDFQLDIFHSDETLQDLFTLHDIANIYTWRRTEPLKLHYVITSAAGAVDAKPFEPRLEQTHSRQVIIGVGATELPRLLPENSKPTEQRRPSTSSTAHSNKSRHSTENQIYRRCIINSHDHRSSTKLSSVVKTKHHRGISRLKHSHNAGPPMMEGIPVDFKNKTALDCAESGLDRTDVEIDVGSGMAVVIDVSSAAESLPRTESESCVCRPSNSEMPAATDAEVADACSTDCFANCDTADSAHPENVKFDWFTSEEKTDAPMVTDELRLCAVDRTGNNRIVTAEVDEHLAVILVETLEKSTTDDDLPGLDLLENKVGFEVDVGRHDETWEPEPQVPRPQSPERRLVVMRRGRRLQTEVRRLLLDESNPGSRRQLRVDPCRKVVGFGFVRAKMRRSPLLRLRSVVRLRTRPKGVANKLITRRRIIGGGKRQN